MKKKLGIIQSRGLGDIVIALPIARHYHDQGQQIYWPVCEQFLSSLVNTVPWVTWLGVSTDARGDFFYNQPQQLLAEAGVTDQLCLYQSLTGQPQLTEVPWFQTHKFDQYKYAAAAVPFTKKWTLSQCITRNLQREQALFDQVIKSDHYCVTHLEGSSWRAQPDLTSLPQHWQTVNCTAAETDCIWDWLTILERAQAIIAIDSVIANIVDQLCWDHVDKYWIPRSHIHLTPVLGSTWTILAPPPGSGAAQRIFASG
jgi:hypothetical protein